jgi:hypothetical protein
MSAAAVTFNETTRGTSSLRRTRTSCVLALALATTPFAAAAQDQYITNGTNVRLRAAPQSTESIMLELPLGTELLLGRSGSANDV